LLLLLLFLKNKNKIKWGYIIIFHQIYRIEICCQIIFFGEIFAKWHIIIISKWLKFSVFQVFKLQNYYFHIFLSPNLAKIILWMMTTSATSQN